MDLIAVDQNGEETSNLFSTGLIVEERYFTGLSFFEVKEKIRKELGI